MKVFYNDRFVASDFEFDTTRKAATIAALVTDRPEIELVDPDPWWQETEDLIADTHSHRYIKAVQTGRPRQLAQSQGFRWDASLYETAVAHNAGVVAAVHTAIDDGTNTATLSSGLHHATPVEGNGFCTFNGLAVGIYAAFTRRGIHRVLVVDFDAHYGGGTSQFWRHSPSVVQIDLTVHDFDAYHGPTHWWHASATPVDYLDLARQGLTHADQQGRYDLCIYNAGVDPVDEDVTPGTLAARDALVAGWTRERGCPTVVTMAGGYESDEYPAEAIAAMHATTIDVFAAH